MRAMWAPWGAGMGAGGPQAPWGAEPGTARARPALSVQVHRRLLGWPRGCQLHPAPALAARAACQIRLGEVGAPRCTGAIPRSLRSCGSNRQREAVADRAMAPGCPAGAGGGCLHPQSEAAALGWEVVASGRVLDLAGECQGLGQPRLEVGDAAGGLWGRSDPFPLHRSPPRWLQGWRCWGGGSPQGQLLPRGRREPRGLPMGAGSLVLPAQRLAPSLAPNNPSFVRAAGRSAALPAPRGAGPAPRFSASSPDARSPWQPSHGDGRFHSLPARQERGGESSERLPSAPPLSLCVPLCPLRGCGLSLASRRSCCGVCVPMPEQAGSCRAACHPLGECCWFGKELVRESPPLACAFLCLRIRLQPSLRLVPRFISVGMREMGLVASWWPQGSLCPPHAGGFAPKQPGTAKGTAKKLAEPAPGSAGLCSLCLSQPLGAGHPGTFGSVLGTVLGTSCLGWWGCVPLLGLQAREQLHQPVGWALLAPPQFCWADGTR